MKRVRRAYDYVARSRQLWRRYNTSIHPYTQYLSLGMFVMEKTHTYAHTSTTKHTEHIAYMYGYYIHMLSAHINNLIRLPGARAFQRRRASQSIFVIDFDRNE